MTFGHWKSGIVPPGIAAWDQLVLATQGVMTVRTAEAAVCRVMNVSPLLRELIERAVRLGALDRTVAAQRHLIAVIRGELAGLRGELLQLPLPRDARAARFARLARQGGEGVSLARQLRQAGASRRTMERLFRAETAMSLGQWLRREMGETPRRWLDG